MDDLILDKSYKKGSKGQKVKMRRLLGRGLVHLFPATGHDNSN
jgi:hypothetical protein